MHRKVFVVKQHDITDCGPACLSSIILYYGGYVPIEILRLKCETNHSGTSVYNLVEAAKYYNFSTTAVRVDASELISKNIFPSIVHLKLENGLNHFAVLYYICEKYVILMDPGTGKVKMSLEEFNKIFTKVAIILKPHSTLVKYEKPNTIRQIITSFFKDNKKTTIKLLLLSFSLVIVSLLLSYFIKLGSLALSGGFDKSLIIYISYIFLLMYFIKNFIDYEKNKIIIFVNKNISADLYEKFSHQLFLLPLNFIKSKTSGEIISRYNELSQINKMIPEIIITTSLDLIMALWSLIFSAFISMKLTLLCCTLMIVYVSVCYVFKNPTMQKINKNITLSGNFNTNIIDNVNSIISTKYINNEVNMERRLEKSGSNYIYNSMNLEQFLNHFNLIKNIVYDAGKWVVIAFGLYLCIDKKLSIINLITFEMIISYFFEAIKDICSMIPSICFFKSSLYKLNEFSIVKEENKGHLDFQEGDILVKDLSYSYDNTNYVLNKINFLVKEKEKVLLQGKSGSGKSTICQILSRQIDLKGGNITIGNTNISDIKIDDFRRNITYIGQKDSLIVDTILKNIIYERNVIDKDLKNICEICEIDEIVKNKVNRYDAVINESCINISGGEKQRIVLARGLLKPGKIIILDEALSEVNKDMEERIIKKIFNYFKDRTIIYVSHKNYKNLFNKRILIN